MLTRLITKSEVSSTCKKKVNNKFFYKDIKKNPPTRLITKFRSLYLQKETRRTIRNVLLLKKYLKIIPTRLKPRVGTYKKEVRTLANVFFIIILKNTYF